MRIAIGLLAAIVVLAGCRTSEFDAATRDTGQADYLALCSGCHGASGMGDGPSAAGLDPRPADLTRLAAENGGEFPVLLVMARVDGYTAAPGAMPEFGQLFADELVPFETAPGIMTPTPPRLIALARYVESLQR
ncbi:cytochrome C [Roseibacterium sp. SDUM158016]|uniref:c-type cytochrome n=1 Tax=Roseicyclus sediminis TaxID=2980997 RepID=UPI0021D07F91|nr:cytochrome C [Roseibacterium sp. SDUM158016]MCU4652701.1 cytochrome C [Roseibacterium sp. SDUM158016]